MSRGMFAAGALLLLLQACGSSAPGTIGGDKGPASDAATVDASSPEDAGGGDVVAVAAPRDASVDGVAVCNELEYGGAPTNLLETMAMAAPTPLGGTIVSGTYYLTKVTMWTTTTCPAPGAASKEVYTFAARSATAGRSALVTLAGTSNLRWSLSYSTSGTKLSQILECVGFDKGGAWTGTQIGTTIEYDYTVSGTSLLIFHDDFSCGRLVYTFDRQ